MRKFLFLAGFLSSFSFAALAQTELIQDGDFESPIFTAWSISAGAGIRNTPTGAAHGGANYLSLGNGAVQVQLAYQTITIPSNAVSAKLAFYVNVVTAVPSASTDELDVALTRPGGGTVITFIDTELGSNPDAGLGSANYRKITFDLTPYAGQTMNLAFQATMGAFGTGTAFNVDDVSIILEMPSDIPPNDYFTNRTVITGTSVVRFGTNYFATKESGEPNHAGNVGGKSLWWSWIAPTNGILQLNTVGTSFVSLLAAYTGNSVSNLTKLASNNGNNNDDGYARINFPVAAQTEVQIAVDVLNNALGGPIVLNLNFKPDTTKPTVAITSPAANAKVPTNAVTVLGTASDNLAIALVQFRLENTAGTNDYQNATGTNKWSALVTDLIAGPNTVRVRAYDTSSNLSAAVARTFNYALTSPLDLSTTGNGRVSPNYSNALLELGATYTLTATPAAGSIFSNWTGTITAITPKLTFTMESNMVLQANFVPNPFIPVKGNYAGLFYDTSGITISNAGYFTAVLADKGTFSSKWQFASATYSLSGSFSADGFYSNAIPRRGMSPLIVQLQLDLSGGETITGTISDGVWTADLAANRAHFSKTTPAPQAGSYTLVIPGSDDSSNAPGGNGIGTLKVDGSGNLTFAGTLGDGTKISQHTFMSKDGQWPLFASLYAKQGLLIGWITFENQALTDLNGPTSWIKLPQPKSKLYPAGFDFDAIEAIGSKYSFTSGTPLLNWTDGQVVLEDGNLSQTITNDLAIDANNKITGANKLALSFTTATGLFHGNVFNPDTGKSIAVNGVLLQKQNVGYGYFLGTDQTGSVFLGPQ